ncbi:MAG: segregation/condensation protein A [Nanobdellota archaeon]
MENQTKLFDIIFNEDEVTWQSMIYKLVREEGMNPWDVNISVLSKRFLDMLHKLKKMDFRISGKVILAAAMLLRIKSRRLVGEDFDNLDRLIAMSDEADDDYDSFDEIEGGFIEDVEEMEKSEEFSKKGDGYKLNTKTPLPRKRKVSVYDLVDALHKALEVKKRRTNRLSNDLEVDVKVPEKQRDITKVIQEVYENIVKYLGEKGVKKLNFSTIVPEGSSKEEKVSTFMPLLYLDNQRKIEMYQERHLSDIHITLNHTT